MFPEGSRQQRTGAAAKQRLAAKGRGKDAGNKTEAVVQSLYQRVGVQIQPDIRRIRAAHIFNIQAYGNEQGKKQKQAAGGFGARGGAGKGGGDEIAEQQSA